MAYETDFLDLYRRLGLHPGCDMAELKQAYRRHVAALHPDRQQGRALDARNAAWLQRLNAQYDAAMEFHRRYGRLPGAPQAASPGGASVSRELSGVVREMHDPFASRRHASSSAMPETSTPVAHRSHGRIALLLVIVALGALGWAMHSASSNSAPAGGDDESAMQAGAGGVAHDAQVAGLLLQVGMSSDDVRALEGDPLSTRGELWEYGPSWIRFDHDEVVEWHSSPLHPLHTQADPAAELAR